MHETIFRHMDNDGDAVEVEHIEEGVSPIGRRLIIEAKGEEGDNVQVALNREEGIKLAHAILNALDAEPETGLSVLALSHKPVGFEVFDRDGDPWVKQQDGQWSFIPGLLTRDSGRLVDEYGPIVAKAPTTKGAS